jgi:nicotinate-nucleotide--dimethylbenzimidazole phosphoribosyltransferase
VNLRERLTDLPGADPAAIEAVHARAADILRPPGALQWLDDVAAWVAGWQRRPMPRVERPVGLVFAADHGVAAAARVSALDPKVTAAMFAACAQGRSTIRSFARHAGAVVSAVDVGIGKPTGDIRFEAALSPERFADIVDIAWAAVDSIDGDLLVVGEMGIGNTTASAAVAAALAGGETAAWVGRGTGIDDATLTVKRAAVQQAVRRIAGVTDPLDVLREVGGSELVAIATAVLAARHRSLPVVLDGYVVTASVLPLVLLAPTVLDHCTVGHCSAEPGHRRLLDRLGKRPLLDLDMRLGEGSGAMAAVPLIAMACAGITEVPTMAEWFGPVSVDNQRLSTELEERPSAAPNLLPIDRPSRIDRRRGEPQEPFPPDPPSPNLRFQGETKALNRFRPSVIASSPTANERRT